MRVEVIENTKQIKLNPKGQAAGYTTVHMMYLLTILETSPEEESEQSDNLNQINGFEDVRFNEFN